MKATRKVFLLIFFIAVISSLWIAQAFTFPTSYQLLERIDGAGLYKQQRTDGLEVYLQIINLHKMKIDQLISEIDNMGQGQGKYYKGEASYYSPFFQMKPVEDVTNEYKELYGDEFFSLINCAFFEQYRSSTQLSFPIKLNGKVITAGSSPYGPISQPLDDFYKTINLKALVWDDRQAYITDYNPATGKPLNESDVQNAIVTYQYSDHPAKVLGENQANRYHVIGTLNFDGIFGDELLLIVTANKATLDEAADLLRQLGVKSNIITIDGGSSTYLFNSRMGNVMLPQPANLKDSPVSRYLPHYLGFRKKGKQQVSPQIKVSQPVGNVEVEENKPYLILWRDNLDDEVTIELYDGDKLIQIISPRTASNGVYEWTPDKPMKAGYSIRISSLKNQKIFGTLQLQ